MVELLVVIGIIAVLISILLPALNKARDQANATKCMSNLHQIGLAVAEYAAENHGFLVPGASLNIGDNSGNPPDNWATTLVNCGYLKVPVIAGGTNTITDTSAGQDSIFRCPSGIDARWGVTGNSSLPTTGFNTGTGFEFTRLLSSTTSTRVDIWYGINGWSIGSANTAVDVRNTFGRYPFTSVPGAVVGSPQSLHHLSDFKESSNLVLIFDGLSWHNQMAYAISARHNGKTVSNALMADGHVEPLKAPGDIPMDTATPPTLKVYVGGRPRFILTSQLNF